MVKSTSLQVYKSRKSRKYQVGNGRKVGYSIKCQIRRTSTCAKEQFVVVDDGDVVVVVVVVVGVC